ncbi:hypothetical protein TYRP_020914, partial [Tyrophagus putrescentiae]
SDILKKSPSDRFKRLLELICICFIWSSSEFTAVKPSADHQASCYTPYIFDSKNVSIAEFGIVGKYTSAGGPIMATTTSPKKPAIYLIDQFILFYSIW